MDYAKYVREMRLKFQENDPEFHVRNLITELCKWPNTYITFWELKELKSALKYDENGEVQ